MMILASAQQVRLERLSPAHWRATFHQHILGPDLIPQLEEIVAAVGCDIGVKVVLVLEDAGEGFSITHCDFLAKLKNPKSLAPDPTGLKLLPMDRGPERRSDLVLVARGKRRQLRAVLPSRQVAASRKGWCCR